MPTASWPRNCFTRSTPKSRYEPRFWIERPSGCAVIIRRRPRSGKAGSSVIAVQSSERLVWKFEIASRLAISLLGKQTESRPIERRFRRPRLDDFARLLRADVQASCLCSAGARQADVYQAYWFLGSPTAWAGDARCTDADVGR